MAGTRGTRPGKPSIGGSSGAGGSVGPRLTESTVEDAALEIFEGLGYTLLRGPTIAPGEVFAERASFGDTVLLRRLREAVGC